MTAQLIEKIKAKNLIFCITPGRSGTNLLAELCKAFPTVDSNHEPDPNFNLALRTVQSNPETAAKFWIDMKFPMIARNSRESYFETSHLFGKGFFPSLLMLGIIPQLVLLRRHPQDVAISMYGYSAIPARSLDGVAHLLNPDDPGVLPLPHWTSMSDYQLCFWYCLEMERRQIIYSTWVERLGKPAITIQMKDLLNADKFLAFSEKLGFFKDCEIPKIKDHHFNICSNNQNPREKPRELKFDTLPQERQVLEFIATYEPFLWEDIESNYKD